MTLNYERKDKWGLPTVTFDAEFKDNELEMRMYVTDDACMTSSGNQNPSLNNMALTTRALDHAVKQFDKNTF